MKFYLRTWSTDEHDNTVGLAFVDIDAKSAKRLLERLKLFEKIGRKDNRLSELRYSDTTSVYYRYDAVSDDTLDDLQDGVIENATTPQEAYEVRTDIDELVVDRDGAHWTCKLKFDDTIITTASLSAARLKLCLGRTE